MTSWSSIYVDDGVKWICFLFGFMYLDSDRRYVRDVDVEDVDE